MQRPGHLHNHKTNKDKINKTSHIYATILYILLSKGMWENLTSLHELGKEGHKIHLAFLTVDLKEV